MQVYGTQTYITTAGISDFRHTKTGYYRTEQEYGRAQLVRKLAGYFVTIRRRTVNHKVVTVENGFTTKSRQNFYHIFYVGYIRHVENAHFVVG